ncbi:protein ORF71 [Lake sturgeon herpesvirus]|nr:protein ORF71 [Lake sturgeon herpesvirus]
MATPFPLFVVQNVTENLASLHQGDSEGDSEGEGDPSATAHLTQLNNDLRDQLQRAQEQLVTVQTNQQNVNMIAATQYNDELKRELLDLKNSYHLLQQQFKLSIPEKTQVFYNLKTENYDIARNQNKLNRDLELTVSQLKSQNRQLTSSLAIKDTALQTEKNQNKLALQAIRDQVASMVFNANSMAFIPQITGRMYKDVVCNSYCLMYETDKDKDLIVNSYVSNGQANVVFDSIVIMAMSHIDAQWLNDHFTDPDGVIKKLDYFYFKLVECETTTVFVKLLWLLKQQMMINAKTHVQHSQLLSTQLGIYSIIQSFKYDIEINSLKFEKHLKTLGPLKSSSLPTPNTSFQLQASTTVANPSSSITATAVPSYSVGPFFNTKLIDYTAPTSPPIKKKKKTKKKSPVTATWAIPSFRF